MTKSDYSEFGAFGQEQRKWRNLPIAELAQRFSYDPETGAITLDGAPNDGWINGDGFVCHKLSSVPAGYSASYLRSRLAFALTVGRWPYEVQHLNGNVADDRWVNLSEVLPSEQALIGLRARHGPSVWHDPASGLWMARLWSPTLKGKAGSWVKSASTEAAARVIFDDMLRIDRDVRAKLKARKRP